MQSLKTTFQASAGDLGNPLAFSMNFRVELVMVWLVAFLAMAWLSIIGLTIRLVVHFKKNKRLPEVVDVVVDADMYWVRPNHSVTIHGFTIADGMVYVGEGLREAGARGFIEPALIDPSLAMDTLPFDAFHSDYYPSVNYARLSPSERGGYLAWLSEGKRDPAAPIEYVLLYFFGLERRLLFDGIDDQERALLFAELQRLYDIYCDTNLFFALKSKQVLNWVRVESATERFYSLEPEPDSEYEHSLINLVALAQVVADRVPLPARWAHTWIKMSPFQLLRTPAERLPEYFALLFMHHYQKEYGDGIILKPVPKPLEQQYVTTSHRLIQPKKPVGELLPDPFAFYVVPHELQLIIESAQKELEPLSRWLGRNPGGEDTLKFATLIPPELFDEVDHPQIGEWRAWLSNFGERTIISKIDLMDRWPPKNGRNLNKTDVLELSRFLQKLGYGLIPDPRFEAISPAKLDQFVLFDFAGEHQEKLSRTFRTLMMAAQAAVAFSKLAGDIDEVTVQSLLQELDDYTHLAKIESLRLRAWVQWLCLVDPRVFDLDTRWVASSDWDREPIADFLLSMAEKKAQLKTSEMDWLKYRFRLLDLNTDRINHLQSRVQKKYGKVNFEDSILVFNESNIVPFIKPSLSDQKSEKSIPNKHISAEEDLVLIEDYRESGEAFKETPSPKVKNLNASKPKEPVWVKPGETVTVQGFTIADGMVYVGSYDRNNAWNWSTEPALIDPSLPVEPEEGNDGRARFADWPSYDELLPSSRAAYLSWLANGKSDSNIDLGYVYLYFYGLERRLLLDEVEGEEQQKIESEVARLIMVYGHDKHFKGYAEELLAVLKLQADGTRIYKTDFDPCCPEANRIGTLIEVGLAQLVYDRKPIPAVWALAWVYQSDFIYLGTPAQRLPEHFKALFCHYYQAQFGEGLRVKPNKSRLQFIYETVNYSLSDYEVPLGDPLPNVLLLKRPISHFQTIVNECQIELDSLSRWIGTDNDRAKSLRALALTPSEILNVVKIPGLDNWRNWLASLGDQGVAEVKELATRWPFNNPEAPTLTDTRHFSLFLQKLGYGMEPDPKFSGPPLGKTDQIVIFPLVQEEQEIEPTQPYQVIKLCLHMAASVAWSKQQGSPAERHFLQQLIEEKTNLSQTEQLRLKAHLHWLLLADPGEKGLKYRCKHLIQGDHQAIGDVLIQMANIDGVVTPEAIKRVEKLFKILKLNVKSVISRIHSQATEMATDQAFVPKSAANNKQLQFELSDDLIQRKKRETAQASQLLGSIFEEELAAVKEVASAMKHPQVEDAADAADVTGAAQIDGLDAAHGRLLIWLGEAEERTRADVDNFCKQLGLFPDGALETLNELAFERCDAALFEEEDDHLEIDLEIYKEIIP